MLPDTFYINQFSDSRQVVLTSFEEDIDPTTMTLPGGRISVLNASRWFETGNKLKGDKLDTHSMVVAWDRKFTTQIARIDFDFTPRDFTDTLVASISAIDIDTFPEGFDDDPAVDEDSTSDDDSTSEEDSDEALDWTIEITDKQGQRASLPLSMDSALYPLVNATPRRAKFLDAEESTEILFRHFQWPLSAFTTANPDFDPSSVTQLSFIFDRSEKGAIIIDDISIATQASISR